MSDMFPIKNVLKVGDSLLSLLFSFQWEGSGKPRWLKIKWCTSATQGLVVAIKEIGLEVYADTTKYLVIS
jgi:predicted RNA-binding protein